MFTASMASSTCSGYPARNGSSICSSSAPASARARASALRTRARSRTRSARVGVGGRAQPSGQRERAGHREPDRPAGVGAGEGEVGGEAERGGLDVGDAGGQLQVEVVEVERLHRLADQHAGHAREQVVDVVVAAQLAVGHHVDARALLVLERGLHRHVVHVGELGVADRAVVDAGLGALQPVGHRPGPDHARRERAGEGGVGTVGQSRTSAVMVTMLLPGRANGAKATSKPLRAPMCASRGPLTQLTTDPSYLPGPRKPVR